ncbi:MAG: Rieske 2Fe-2S domain-containing protein [Thermomicrobiales bacterium]
MTERAVLSTTPRRTREAIPVAALGDLAPGEMRLVEAKGHSIGLFNVDGEYIAVLNVCPHELAPVCRGRLSGTTLPSMPGEFIWGREGEIISCPWHGWEFDLLTGKGLADSRVRVRRYDVVIDGDTIAVLV